MLLLIVFVLSSFVIPQSTIAMDTYELDDGYMTVVDEEGETILKTGRRLVQGNKYLNQDNKLYEVTNVTDDKAEAELIEEVELSSKNHEDTENPLSFINTHIVYAQDRGPIGIYHSHGAESYVPSDGAESIDEGGGILQVGESFAQSLEENTVDVIWREETHVPHDAGAYMRSRRTVEDILEENPDALIDVHRDAAPRDQYKAEIEGEERVSILLVVGQQNQNIQETEQFAERIKATADEMYPNLVKGILYAQGDYNQDLHPRNILIEIGGHNNTREGAKESADLFADVLTKALYEGVEEGEPRGAVEDEGGIIEDDEGGIAGGGVVDGPDAGPPGALGTVGRTILWIGGVVIVGGFLFLLLNEGSLQGVASKFKQFVSTEFANFMGPSKKNSKQRRSQEDQEDDDS
ncbi:stage II sporulation protein P [Natranaerobius trueperi]|uniref:stage II sporulation protein P n=1 Tax=Natranaerobius trueperi TaxID=759412 RepID=UPI00197C2A36|nr:stage II sporulation protein P [Natranaerobius trueperi]